MTEERGECVAEQEELSACATIAHHHHIADEEERANRASVKSGSPSSVPAATIARTRGGREPSCCVRNGGRSYCMWRRGTTSRLGLGSSAAAGLPTDIAFLKLLGHHEDPT
ncbi:hypothetical protein AAHE18_08G103000 [Arachis hypogaea]